jgi:hypothetical protein
LLFTVNYVPNISHILLIVKPNSIHRDKMRIITKALLVGRLPDSTSHKDGKGTGGEATRQISCPNLL